jgi:hypothetical protein
MPAIFQAKQIVNNLPVLSADGATDTITVVGDFTTVAGMAASDVIEMCGLPAGYVPVDVAMAIGASAGATFTTDCGVMSGSYGVADAARTVGNEAWAGSTVGQGAAGLARALKPNILQLAPSSADRGIGIKVATLATLVVGTAIRLNLLCRPQQEGV